MFETEGVKQEAQGFLDVNTGRKPITSTGRHKAMVAAGNDTASFVQSQIDALGLDKVPDEIVERAKVDADEE